MFVNPVIMEMSVKMVHCASIRLNAVAKVHVEFINSQTERILRNVCVKSVILETIAQITRV